MQFALASLSRGRAVKVGLYHPREMLGLCPELTKDVAREMKKSEGVGVWLASPTLTPSDFFSLSGGQQGKMEALEVRKQSWRSETSGVEFCMRYL